MDSSALRNTCRGLSSFLFVALILCTLLILVHWFFIASFTWGPELAEKNRHSDFLAVWRKYLVWFVLLYGAVFFRLGALLPSSIWAALILPVVGTTALSIPTYHGLKAHIEVLRDQIPMWPKARFPETITLDVPEGCRLLRGIPETGASCRFSAPNDNMRLLSVSRLDLPASNLAKQLGVDSVSGEESSRRLSEDHGICDQSVYLWKPISCESRVLGSEETPESFTACVSDLVELAASDDVTAVPSTGSSGPERFVLENDQGKRLIQKEFRCFALYPETERVIYFSITIEEFYKGDGLSEDFMDLSGRLLESLTIVEGTIPNDASSDASRSRRN